MNVSTISVPCDSSSFIKISNTWLTITLILHVGAVGAADLFILPYLFCISFLLVTILYPLQRSLSSYKKHKIHPSNTAVLMKCTVASDILNTSGPCFYNRNNLKTNEVTLSSLLSGLRFTRHLCASLQYGSSSRYIHLSPNKGPVTRRGTNSGTVDFASTQVCPQHMQTSETFKSLSSLNFHCLYTQLKVVQPLTSLLFKSTT